MNVCHKTMVRGVLGRQGGPIVYIQNCGARIREANREQILTVLVNPDVSCVLTANEIGYVSWLAANLNRYGGLKAEAYAEDGRTWAQLVMATMPEPAATAIAAAVSGVAVPIDPLVAKLAETDARLAEQRAALAERQSVAPPADVPSWMDEEDEPEDDVDKQDVVETEAGSTTIIVPGLTINPVAPVETAASTVVAGDIEDDEESGYAPAPIAPEGVVLPPPRARIAADVLPVLGKRRGRPPGESALKRAQEKIGLAMAGSR